MPLEAILQKYGFVLRRDRNGKQSVIDFDELRKQFENQGGTQGVEEVVTDFRPLFWCLKIAKLSS